MSRSGHRALVVLLIAFLVVGHVYSVVNPVFEASDELWHYPFVKYVADGLKELDLRLPVQQPGLEQPWRQEGSQPPLYYAIAALATFWIDTDDLEEIRWRNPHADIGIPKPDGNVNMVIHTEREAFPYRGTVLAVHIIRWLSLLMGAVTVLCAYLMALEVFPERYPLALGAAAFVAFNPMFLFISDSVNNDNLATMLSSFTLWRLLRLTKGEDKLEHLALLGLTLGAAVLAKSSALGLFPLVGLGLLYSAYCDRSWHTPLRGGAVIYGLAVLVAGWWFVRNWRLYGDPTGLSTFVAIVGPRHPKPTLRQLWGERVGFTMSFWGFFGGVNVPMSMWLYRALDAFAAFGLAGLIVFLATAWRDVAADARFRLLLLLAWPTIVFASLIRWTMMTIATQGRLLFASLSAIAVLLVMGWLRWAPRHAQAVASAVISIGFALVAIAAPFVYIAPAYARPPILTEADLPTDMETLGVSFGERMRLLGYILCPTEARPGDTVSVTLYWQSLARMEEDYSVFVHLLSDQGLIIGQRDMYPGHGTYPTSLWTVGDIVADTYIVPIQPATLAPATAQLEVGLYLLSTGARLPAGGSLGDSVRFGQVTILPRHNAAGIPNPVYFSLEDRIALVGYDLDRAAAHPGEAFHLVLYWRSLKGVEQDYSVFTQVIGEGNRIWAQEDAWPQEGNAPTSTWRPGQIIEDRYELIIKDDAPAGVYDLQVGMYLSATGKRLKLLGEGGHVQDDRIVLGKVRIIAR